MTVADRANDIRHTMTLCNHFMLPYEVWSQLFVG